MRIKAIFKNKYVRYSLLLLASAFLVWFTFFSLPKKPFDNSYSKVLYSEEGNLLNAQVALDQQWRFPADQPVTEKFEQCILTFEDKNFHTHIGISAKGIGRAIVQNTKRGKVVSGGSTITMQTIRLMKQNPKRTIGEKMLEMTLALRLELRYSKKEILQMYCAHAPFGNNVVGLEAASWRYFGKKTTALTWGENALLAVLPNSPGLLYPGKNHERLMNKRNRLLQKLFAANIIDKQTLQLSLDEPIPDKPLPLPDMSRHYFSGLATGSQSHVGLNYRVQEQCSRIADVYAQKYNGNQVQNIAIIVSDLHSGKTLAYIGNTDKKWNNATAFVDCAKAPRSTGSILKPLLYYKCLSTGLITPNRMLFDIPVAYNNFRPQNYARTYEGLIPANKALSKSLNIPMVGLLSEYGLQKFHADLRTMGFRHFTKPASHYGLSLILGSGEVSLQELNQTYGNWVRTMLLAKGNTTEQACVYETLEAMTELNRPDESGNWKAFMNTQKIAWKTGTSFGNRDAWCLGISANYVVTVWVGNADGSGRTGLTGIEYAAPILFDIFNALPKNYTWFKKPTLGYKPIELCKVSGHKAGSFCEEKIVSMLPTSCVQVSVCPFHKALSVNKEGTMQVNASVYNWQDIVQKPYLILPPAVSLYFKTWNPSYKPPPPWHTSLNTVVNDLQIIFPNQNKILLFGNANEMTITFKAISADKKGILYWHADDEYLGSTTNIHELQYTLPIGKHQLAVIDEMGNSKQTTFELVKTN